MRVGKCCTPDSHGRVFLGGVDLDGLGGGGHQLRDVRHLHLLECPLHHRAAVEQIRILVHHGHDRLGLRHALRFGEDVRIRHRNHIGIPIEILALDVQFLHNVALVHLVQVPPVDTLQDLEHTRLRVVQTGVNGREHLRALLDQRLGGAHRGRGAHVGDLFLGGRDHALCGLGQEPHKLEQRLARRVERHRHGDLADVVHTRCAFDLGDLRYLDVLRLARYFRSFELKHRGRVINMRSIKQSTKTASNGSRKTPNKMRKTNRIGTSPWDEFELDNPVELGHLLVALFPIPVQTHDLVVEFVDHQNVGGQLAFRI